LLLIATNQNILKEVQLLNESRIASTVHAIRDRSLSEGAFALNNGESFRPDTTAWAVLALETSPGNRDVTVPACRRLAKSQLSDGRVPVIEGHSESYWPTALAVLAWKKVAGFERQVGLALKFLLNATGRHWPRQKDAPIAHDTSLKGWPWTENTHSWIEPTALSILALKVCGYLDHNRVLEATQMILDRQLPSGGWNYGNTRAFGTMLRPNPVDTGYALSALAGLTESSQVKLSLDYLQRKIERLRTPLALSWSVFGLSAWSGRPAEACKWILESLSLQKRYGAYETTLLAQLVVAYFTSDGLLSLFYN
jgi:hypothetical protein